jgi:cell volume regulation protein A
MGVGAIAGVIVGYLAIRVVNAINLDAAGLYPVLVTAFGLLAFGSAVAFGGSGFLAIYLAGIVIGNGRIVFQRGILLFHDAAAWLSQIVMFVVLGLLSFPSRLLDVAWHGLAVGIVLMLIARPLAVMPFLFPFRYNWRESIFVSWVGLKGAVPITLATFPLMFGTPHASLMFDVVFFVVVLSATVQGWSLPLAARRLGLEIPLEMAPPLTLEISSLRHVDGDIVDYTVGPDSRAAGRQVKDLALPEGVVIAVVAKGQKIIPPQGRTRIEAGDHVIIVLRPEMRKFVNQVFGSHKETRAEEHIGLEFPFRGTTTVGELEDMYGISMGIARELTLEEALRTQIGQPIAYHRVARFGAIGLRARRLAADMSIEQVGMTIYSETEQIVPANDALSSDS